MQRACAVFTTIFDPVILDSYYHNFDKFGHLDQIEVIVIPDKKTPASAWERCRDLTARGVRADCPTLDEQEAFLKTAGLPADFVPYNSDNRRNVGYLMALARDCDFVISLDDDNFARDDEDAFAAHSIVAAPSASLETIDSPSGLFNICSLLDFENGPLPVYPRGYPFAARHRNDPLMRRTETGEVHVNAGLWLLDPDIDAISWLTINPHAIGFHGPSQVLARNTWSPINTQNTALRREVLAAYYFLRMGYPIAGTAIDRYGDIFSGYFAEACVKHLGGFVRAGTPVADHRRNSHNYMKDAGLEFGAILVLEDLVSWLREVKLSGSTYVETYRSLSAAIADAAERFDGPLWNDSMRGFLHRSAHYMRRWAEACAVLNAG
jgi:hypothetical protein